jgi:glycosyltransferase involved in cell wall biosynthesis
VTVIYDLLGFQSRYHPERGIARFVLQLALGLERVRPGLVSQYVMHPDLPFPAGAEALVATGRVVRSDQERSRRRPSRPGVFVAGSPFESFHLPSEHVLPEYTRSGHWRTAAVLHDLVPMRYPDIYLTRTVERYAFQARFAAVSRFDHLLVNSSATAEEALEYIHFDPKRITVIGAGADDRFQRPSRPSGLIAIDLAAEGEVPGLRPGYVLLPSGIDPRKNLERAIRAYGRVDPELRRCHQLVLVCQLSEDDQRTVAGWVAEAGIGDDFLATGYVSDDLLCRLYHGAHLVLFPSLYEGFGLPALEAMQCGAPVICGDSSALKEVQTLADARFDPTSIEAIAEAVERVLIDHGFRRSLRDQALPPFTWDNAARLAGGVIDELLAPEQLRLATPSRSRLALFGPLDPDGSDTARYLAELVEELRHQCDITVFIPGELPGPRIEGVSVLPSSHFEAVERGGGAFDEVIHVLGDDPGCVDSFRSLMRRSGWVLLHDLHLAVLYGQLADLHPDEVAGGSVGRHLTHLYPHRYRPELEQLERIDAVTAERAGILLAAEVAEAADEILVHSNFEASLVTLDTGAQPEVLFPLPCPEPTTSFPRRHRPPVMASFGPVAAGRRLDELVSALASIRQRVPGVRLRLIGPIDPEAAEDLQALARAGGVGRAVELIGDLGAEELAAAQLEATVAVQLHMSSWTPTTMIGQLLSRGIPTVVSDLGPASELPDDAVIKVHPADAPDRLAELISQLLLEPSRRTDLIDAGLRYAKATSFTNAAAAIHERLAR